MNQELLNKFVNEMSDLLKTAKDFTMEQVPAICKEVINYNLAISSLYLLSSIVILFLTIWMWKKSYEIDQKGNECSMSLCIPLGMCTFLISTVMFFYNIDDFIKCLFAPRLYLIEYFAHLIKHKH